MVENSVTSNATTQSAPRSTRKTAKLTLGQALDVLTQACRFVEEAGGEINLDTEAGRVMLEIIGTTFKDGRIVPIQSADISAQE